MKIIKIFRIVVCGLLVAGWLFFVREVQGMGWQMVVVSVLLLVTIMWGFVSLLKARLEIREEMESFEKRREKELIDEKGNNNDALSTLKSATHVHMVTLRLTNNEKMYGNKHHAKRYECILKAVYGAKMAAAAHKKVLLNENDGSTAPGALPSLTDLRTLTYASEASRPHVWSLRVVCSVLLIIGILGTLVGVHAAIPTVEGMHMEELSALKPALLPSAIAVFFTVLFIIWRSFYDKAFDRYVGRLDRHTVCHYFPLLRPAERDAAYFKEMVEGLTMFNTCLGGVFTCISAIKLFPARVLTQMKSLGGVASKQQEAYDSVENENIASQYDMLMSTLLSQRQVLLNHHEALVNAVQRVSEKMQAATKNMFNSSGGGSFSSYQAELDELKASAALLSDRAVSDVAEIKSKMESIANLDERLLVPMRKNATAVRNLMDETAQQGRESGAAANEVNSMYRYMKERVEKNVSAHGEYRHQLDDVYENCRTRMANHISTMRAVLKNLSRMEADLNTRIESYDREPVLHWYEIVVAVIFVAVLLCNVTFTISKF